MIWDAICFERVAGVLALELLRVGFEAAIVAQFALFALFVLATGDKRRPSGFFLSALCGAMVTAVLINALVAAGAAPALRTINYFIDLATAPLVLGFVARAGEVASPLRRLDGVHVLGPAIGGLILATGWAFGPDVYVIAVQLAYLTAAVIAGQRREPVLRAAGLMNLARALIGAFALVLMLRLWVVIDAQSLQSYRDSAAYLLILAVVLALGSFLLWTVLRTPGLLARRAATMTAEGFGVLEGNLERLIEGERLYLEPNLTVADVAARLRAEPRHVSNVISARTGDNFSSYINGKRAEAAANALRSTPNMRVTTIMFESGFGSKSAFQREFKRCFGVTPTQYRQKFLAKQGKGLLSSE